ncbi:MULTISPECIES: DODA-type extradiol aromatic ring-opening family dioxygenase [Acinetobacter]|uniref:DODA-type extradiol aromatic ring-opening family dioxygenase n=1 Tax=Acinetobacter TaxID=469 RepID=UPI0015D21462|nr:MULTISPECIES: class III extradiol ring-cleavage dioxygenase [Acinetobacter]GIT83652.1 dioxygenase [Acinetobacter seohaensis]MCO8054116.1 dioxygenase [Acinetobacter towneri]MDM1284092.1 dioxygenase [Acinetobacter towneri]MDV2454238.1 class III extradiol ring-cleavage dioxygenase [Acinetobacter towneri]UNT61158.1 dioxygenase [Acinetobacter towneri]
MNLQTLPGLFISHGSPMLALNPEQVGPALSRLSENLPTPQAIVVMSAHWESNALEVNTGIRPETWHDFRGFPEALYALRYPAPGLPELAEDILQRLADAGFAAHANSTRPHDHGVWMPLLHMYPDANIPVITISLPMNMSAEQIYHIGQSLAPLREQQILLIGSGSITHNLRELSWNTPNAAVPEWAFSFRNRVVQHLSHRNYDAVLDWQQLPHVARNHPTLEHFAPLFFAMGTGDRFNIVHSSFSMGSLGMDIYRFD